VTGIHIFSAMLTVDFISPLGDSRIFKILLSIPDKSLCAIFFPGDISQRIIFNVRCIKA
jgi:hypothetical protein